MTLMKMRFRFAVGVGTILAASIGVVACGGDDTTVGEPSDAGTDGTVIGDGGGKLDGSSDATVGDGSTDAGDASSDGATDAGDAAPLSITAELTDFQNQLAAAYCTKFATACAAADAGVVNVADGGTSCVSTISSGTTPVYQGSTNGYDDVNATSRGDISFNNTTARLCVTEISAVDYGNISAAAYKQATHDCFTVVQGSLPQGAGCYESIECASNLYCKKGTYTGAEPDAGADAGDAAAPPAFTGACQALEVAGPTNTGTVCNDYPAGDSCSYLGVPGTAFCDFNFADINDANLYCQPTAGGTDGQGCTHDVDCVSGLCDPHNTVCVESTSNYVSDIFCGSYP